MDDRTTVIATAEPTLAPAPAAPTSAKTATVSQRATRIVSDFADRQQGLVTRRQLIEGGTSPGSIRGRIRSNAFHTVVPGVYFVGRGPMSADAVRMAAVLGAGKGAVLAGRSAAVMYGFLDRERVLDVRSANSRARPNFRVRPPVGHPATVHVRRYREQSLRSIKTIRGIPVVDPATALLQVAEELTPKQMKNAFIAADLAGLLGDDELAWLVEPKMGHKGAGELRTLILKRNPEITKTRSVLEAKFLDLLDDAGLPRPQVNAPLAGYRTDFFWEEAGLIVEVDGARYHRGVSKLNDDQNRENELVAVGNSVLRFDWGQVEHEGEGVAALVATSLARRGVVPAV